MLFRSLATLEATGELERTLVVYVSDNGWQMPRGLANCYDRGSRVPLAIRWGGRRIADAGADTFVAGSAIFSKRDADGGYKTVVGQLRAQLAQANGVRC